MTKNQIAKTDEREDEGTALVSIIERAARDPSVDIDKMERLLQMQERVFARRASAEFDDAMRAAQAEMEPIVRNRENTQTRSRYATYGATDKAIRAVYVKHGFSVSHTTRPSEREDEIIVVCVVSHVGGCTREYPVPIPTDGKGAKGNAVMTRTHAVGSALQYGRRYSLYLAFNLATDDDDGNAAAATSEKISAEQVQELVDLADEIGIDKVKFCKWANVDSIADIYADKFDIAKRAMEAKRK